MSDRIAVWLASAPRRRTGFVAPDRLDRKVYDRHEKWGAGYPLHVYDSQGRCVVDGCDIFDPSEAN